MLCIFDSDFFKFGSDEQMRLNKDPRYIRHSSSPSLSRNFGFVLLIKDGGLSEDDAVYTLCTVTNKNLYIKNPIWV